MRRHTFGFGTAAVDAQWTHCCQQLVAAMDALGTEGVSSLIGRCKLDKCFETTNKRLTLAFIATTSTQPMR